MPEIHGLAVHQRTATLDAMDTARFAFMDRLWRNAALTERPVKPHLADAECSALTYELNGDVRMGGDYEAVDRARY